MSELASVAAFTFAPLGAVMVAMFLFSLCLAPAALAYEAAIASIAAIAQRETAAIGVGKTNSFSDDDANGDGLFHD